MSHYRSAGFLLSRHRHLPRRRLSLIRASAAAVLLLSCINATAAEDLRATYRFLVTPRSTHQGALSDSSTSTSGNPIPLSFYDSADYWGTHVCSWPATHCAVTDRYDPGDYAIKPQKGPAGVLQTERVNAHNGSNIYDAATWQIAVMLGSAVNGFQDAKNAYELVSAQNRRLASWPTATTRGRTFLYNGRAFTPAEKAYSFRMASENWLATDPLHGSRYANLVTTVGIPATATAEYQPGRISWSDWKPITGENAWAHLIGPLQAAYLQYVVQMGGRFIPFRELAVQNALQILPAFSAMQSALGAVYYAPSGTLSNDKDEPVDPYSVAIENNFSLYAGLNILHSTLQAELTHDKTLSNDDRKRIQSALQQIHAMTSGGQLPDGRTTQGLLSFFKEAAWHEGEFLQGGIANDPKRNSPWVPTLRPKAVDVNTWGIAALGAALIDEWHGFGAAYGVWQKTQRWGAYGVGRTLWGVGYSDTDGNGRNDDGTYRQGILSAEWTAGAIIMVRNLIRHYGGIQPGSADYAAASQYARRLRSDADAMIEGVGHLRFESYLGTAFPGKPANYASLIKQTSNPYLYASKRYAIPFGWYANPIPSTASTAWMIMVADDYDPLGYGGKPN